MLDNLHSMQLQRKKEEKLEANVRRIQQEFSSAAVHNQACIETMDQNVVDT